MSNISEIVETGWMDYENYRELYEAVYLFNRIWRADNKLPQIIGKDEIRRTGINESIYKAVMRILVVNKLLDFNGNCFVLTEENMAKHRYILDAIINKDQSNHYTEFYAKATNESQFFFDSISALEYEIYSRCNLQVTYETGKEVAKHVNAANKNVLELGGNSGGLGTALLAQYINCKYTVVDTKIPCMVGNEFKESNNINISFIECDVFALTLPNESYDTIIIMNLLHDFDDGKCLDILRNGAKYCHKNTKFIIIEDILTSEFELKEIIMHGLRLSVECRGGRQRTAGEVERLFSSIQCKPEKTIQLDAIHTMLIFGFDNK